MGCRGAALDLPQQAAPGPQPCSGWEAAWLGGLCPLLHLNPQLQRKGLPEFWGGWQLGSSLPPPLPPGCWLRVASPQPLFGEDKARA